jgi:hypothetical protein
LLLQAAICVAVSEQPIDNLAAPVRGSCLGTEAGLDPFTRLQHDPSVFCVSHEFVALRDVKFGAERGGDHRSSLRPDANEVVHIWHGTCLAS